MFRHGVPYTQQVADLLREDLARITAEAIEARRVLGYTPPEAENRIVQAAQNLLSYERTTGRTGRLAPVWHPHYISKRGT